MVLYVVAKQPQNPHVADYMHPTAMQKNGRQQIERPEVSGDHAIVADE